jgi:hypothetical protein
MILMTQFLACTHRYLLGVMHWAEVALHRPLKQAEPPRREDMHDFRFALDLVDMEETIVVAELGDLVASIVEKTW